MPKNALRCLSLFLLAVLLAPALAFAQAEAAGGAIQGTVTDTTGAVLPGVALTVRNQETGVVRETRSDPVGLFRAPLLPVGVYEVTATLPGFATTQRPSLMLTVGSVLAMRPGPESRQPAEEVTVTAEAPVIETSGAHRPRPSTSGRCPICR